MNCPSSHRGWLFIPYTIYIPNKVTHTMSENMSYTEVLYRMDDIRKAWRENDFRYPEGMKDEYDLLVAVRRERVSSFYRDNMVWKGRQEV